MAADNQTDPSGQNTGLQGRNALILKIALFLNYISKENHQKLLKDFGTYQNSAELDILKLVHEKNYILQADILSLKKICQSFSKAQEDARLGSLCISFGFLTQSNLDLALEEQKRLAEQGRYVMLGNLLVEAGMISEKQRNLILQKQKLENSVRKTGKQDGQPASGEPAKTAASQNPSPAPAFDKSRMREIREAQIIILIQYDGLNAFITKTIEFDNSMVVAELKFLLEKNGIIYGLIDDQSFEEFIKDEKYQNDFLKAAEGLVPINGIDAQIVYMFDRDYLKPGRLAEDGTIDFKERGEIPFVSEGGVLAEKIPAKEGKDGVSVFGEAIPYIKAKDMAFILGKGVRLSRDGLKVLSEVNGNPKVKPTGELSVNDSYFIEGDVDYTTGHVKFDKNVFIRGAIKSGFRVEAIDVVANAIDGGIVKAQGDVFIQNGATESVIEAKGNIKAGFMHRSKAACMGNMTVVKEIVDTEILIEGAFEMSRGSVYSSAITAKGGARIYNVGSDKAKPSAITVGTSVYLEKELANIDSAIERRQNLLETRTIEKNRIESEIDIIAEKLSNFDQSRQRTLAMMDEMKKDPAGKIAGKIDLFQKSLDQADIKIHALKNEKAVLEANLTKISQDILSCAQAVKISVKDKLALKRIQQANPPKPVLDVAGKIFAGTRIHGRYSNTILTQTVSRSRVMEITSRADDGSKKNWEMIIANL